VAAVATFLVAFGVYFYCMSPEVTLQDSGELVTGAFHFGVPHPTGYPTWTFLGWVWRHLVPFGNPAWRLGLFSVVTGATLVGILTLLMTRSILMLLRNCSWGAALEEPVKNGLSLSIGTMASLMFAFNRGVWQWACVPEMRALNAFSYVATTCLLFAWMMRPQHHRYLYTLLLVWGLSLANHQTIIIMLFPIVIGMWMVGFFGDPADRLRYANLMEFGFACFVAWTAGVLVNAWLLTGPNDSLWNAQIKTVLLFGPKSKPLPVVLLAGGSAAALLALGIHQRMLHWPRAVIGAVIFLGALSMYAYMPVAASTNPPMNWGFAATKQGFLHAITRGQYEQIRISWPTTEKFWIQMGLFIQALLKQYGWILGVFAVVPALALWNDWKRLQSRARQWLIFSLAAFLIAWIGLIFIINPEIDKVNQEINLKFFVGAHGFFAMLLGYGVALTLAWGLTRWPQIPQRRVMQGSWVGLACVAIPFTVNRAACDCHGQDFGYQFGYRMFAPGGGYEPMEKDAVLFGGTDPGRFVPTYMIFCESFVGPRQRYRDPWCDPEGGPKFDRRDVYIITQNALADSTYLSYIRDHYDHSRPDPNKPATLEKFDPWQRAWLRFAWRPLHRHVMYPREPIRIPTEKELSLAFQQYVNETRGRMLNPEEEVTFDPAGRVSVRGVAGVMAINGILTKWIFDWNKDKHAFYVEESYVIPWMYPYLTPHGNIMKINRDIVPTPQENPELWAMIVKRDKAYWDDLCKQFLARPEFRRSTDAQRAFAKLRSAIGGIYAYRRMIPEAEYAFQQARKLCPDSPEANFRLAQLYIEQGRIDDALAVIKSLLELDPLNPRIRQAVDQMENMRRARNEIGALEAQWRTNANHFPLLVQLAQTYARLGQIPQLLAACQTYLSQTNRTAIEYLNTAQMLISAGQIQPALAIVQTATQHFPQDPQVWYAAALLLGGTGQNELALSALTHAIQLAPALRDQARTDPRFGPLARHPRFQNITEPR